MEQRRRPAAPGLSGPPLWCVTAALMVVASLWTSGAPQRFEVAAAAASSKRLTVTVMPVNPDAPSRSFSVVLMADTPKAREKGLQGFRALKPREAALFVFDPPQQVSFWMASLTYAIDIIYVDAAGTVTEVFPGCQPESREVFSSAGPVRWVIETAAGSGIRPGDGVRFE